MYAETSAAIRYAGAVRHSAVPNVRCMSNALLHCDRIIGIGRAVRATTGTSSSSNQLHVSHGRMQHAMSVRALAACSRQCGPTAAVVHSISESVETLVVALQGGWSSPVKSRARASTKCRVRRRAPTPSTPGRAEPSQAARLTTATIAMNGRKPPSGPYGRGGGAAGGVAYKNRSAFSYHYYCASLVPGYTRPFERE